jgi:hypothetical protein
MKPEPRTRTVKRYEPSARELLEKLLCSPPRNGKRIRGLTVGGAAEIRRIAARDYNEDLRRCLSRQEVRRVLAEGRKTVWPALNRQPVKLVSPQEFARRWSALGVEIKFARLPAKRDLSLLGFYTKEISGVRRRPLICVNTAHHPAIVGAALDHEMGHHVTARMFTPSRSVARFLSRSGYEEHLTDKSELAADILVSVGIYPARVARRLLSSAADGRGRPELAYRDFVGVLEYIATQYGLSFDLELPGEKKFQALAALLHYTKLRRAVLEEYGI